MAKKNKNEITIRSSAAEYLTFVASTGDSQDSFEMRYEDENIWLTQKMMATLYDVDVRTINEHLVRIFSDEELKPESTIRNFRIVDSDGKTYDTYHYNLQTRKKQGEHAGSPLQCEMEGLKWNIIPMFITGGAYG
ncbi:MAG: hypothetical protein LBQ36_09800 [Synergistaceae bacterium]|jgi:hypothetical protein|nr:hypothetical protein [Synergistaceae bacterium]